VTKREILTSSQLINAPLPNHIAHGLEALLTQLIETDEDFQFLVLAPLSLGWALTNSDIDVLVFTDKELGNLDLPVSVKLETKTSKGAIPDAPVTALTSRDLGKVRKGRLFEKRNGRVFEVHNDILTDMCLSSEVVEHLRELKDALLEEGFSASTHADCLEIVARIVNALCFASEFGFQKPKWRAHIIEATHTDLHAILKDVVSELYQQSDLFDMEEHIKPRLLTLESDLRFVRACRWHALDYCDDCQVFSQARDSLSHFLCFSDVVKAASTAISASDEPRHLQQAADEINNCAPFLEPALIRRLNALRKPPQVDSLAKMRHVKKVVIDHISNQRRSPWDKQLV
jgi:hypothetical protein